MNYCKLGDLCQIEKGKIGITKAVEGQYPLVTTAETRGSHNEYHFDKPAVIIPLVSSTGHGHASINRLHYQEGKFAVGSILAVLTPKNSTQLNAQYLYTFLSTNKDHLLVSLMRGAANVSLSIARVKDVEIPVPPMNRQLEIVKKFNNLQSVSTNFQDQIDNRSTLLENLKEQILQDAITGKLTEQLRKENPIVESAEVLLEKIKAEKEKLIKEVKIKKQKPLIPIDEKSTPFKIPKDWAWLRLNSAFIFIDYRGKTPIKIEKGIPLITAKNVKKGLISKEPAEFIDPKIYSSWMTRGIPQINDILITTEAPLGNVALLNTKEKVVFAQRVIVLHPYSKIFNTSFYVYFMLSIHFQKQLIEKQSGATAKGIKSSKLKNLIIPLPPIEEQLFIVQFIEALLKKLNLLKLLNEDTKESINQLNQVLLKEMFEK